MDYRGVNRYRKKPIEIEAVQWLGGNASEIKDFCGEILGVVDETSLIVSTLEGDMRVRIGDFIVKGIKGEFYPCKADIFFMTYDLVE